MKSESENLTAQQSIDIITAMIEQAKGNAHRSNFFFLFWGWIALIANVGFYVLATLNYEHPYLVWSITIPAWIYTLYRVFSRDKNQTTKTHFDKIRGWLWISFGITIFVIIGFGYKINFQLMPLILIITAIPTFVSGIIMKFKPFVLGGIAFWMFGIIGFLVSMQMQPLVGAAAIACGYLIPGYMLKRDETM